jgi:hypothetical protein
MAQWSSNSGGAVNYGDSWGISGSSVFQAPPTSSDLPAHRISTTTTLDNSSAILNNSATFLGNLAFRTRSVFIVKPVQTTLMSMWVAWCNGPASAGAGLRANDNPLNAVNPHRYFGFRYSTQAGDTNWQVVLGDNGNQTIYDTGIAPGTTTPVVFAVEWGKLASEVRFYINNVRVYTGTTHLPPYGDLLGQMVSLRNREAGVVKSFDAATLKYQLSLV